MALSASLFLRQTQSLVIDAAADAVHPAAAETHLELNQFIAQEVEKNPLSNLHQAMAKQAAKAARALTSLPTL